MAAKNELESAMNFSKDEGVDFLEDHRELRLFHGSGSACHIFETKTVSLSLALSLSLTSSLSFHHCQEKTTYRPLIDFFYPTL